MRNRTQLGVGVDVDGFCGPLFVYQRLGIVLLDPESIPVASRDTFQAIGVAHSGWCANADH
jgi:hypothetical protein